MTAPAGDPALALIRDTARARAAVSDGRRHGLTSAAALLDDLQARSEYREGTPS